MIGMLLVWCDMIHDALDFSLWVGTPRRRTLAISLVDRRRTFTLSRRSKRSRAPEKRNSMEFDSEKGLMMEYNESMI